MTPIRIAFLATLVALAGGATAPAALADNPWIADSLRNPSLKQKLEQVIARRKALGIANPRITVTDQGSCSDGLPTCYDGPSNTITIAGDPTHYHYRTKPQPGQPATFPYSWDRAVYREAQRAFVWWVEERREGAGTEAYDQAYILPVEPGCSSSPMRSR